MAAANMREKHLCFCRCPGPTTVEHQMQTRIVWNYCNKNKILGKKTHNQTKQVHSKVTERNEMSLQTVGLMVYKARYVKVKEAVWEAINSIGIPLTDTVTHSRLC